MQEKLEKIRKLINQFNKESKLHKITLAHAKINTDNIIDHAIDNFICEHEDASQEQIDQFQEDFEKTLNEGDNSIYDYDYEDIDLHIESPANEKIYWRSSSLSC